MGSITECGNPTLRILGVVVDFMQMRRPHIVVDGDPLNIRVVDLNKCLEIRGRKSPTTIMSDGWMTMQSLFRRKFIVFLLPKLKLDSFHLAKST